MRHSLMLMLLFVCWICKQAAVVLIQTPVGFGMFAWQLQHPSPDVKTNIKLCSDIQSYQPREMESAVAAVPTARFSGCFLLKTQAQNWSQMIF